MQETLICQEGGHKWVRERKRGVKPRYCPEHKPAVTPPAEPRAELSEPISVVSDEALELLTSDSWLDPEFRRKLSYCVEQLERGRMDEEDVKLLKNTRDRLMEQHARTLHA